MLSEHGANDAETFSSKHKTTFLCQMCIRWCYEWIYSCDAEWWRPCLWLEKGFAFAYSQLFLHVREMQLKPPLVLISPTTLTPSAAVTAWPCISEQSVETKICLSPFRIVLSAHCKLIDNSISTNKRTIIYIMYFTINLLLRVSAQFPSSGSLQQCCNNIQQ
jgi:hypothetical protein